MKFQYDYVDQELIEQLVNALGEEYLRLPITVKIFTDIDTALLDYMFSDEFVSFCDRDNCNGQYEITTDTIYVYAYSVAARGDENWRTQVIHTFVHELRHCWQVYYMADKVYEDIIFIEGGNVTDEYLNQWVEADAREFAAAVMREYFE